MKFGLSDKQLKILENIVVSPLKNWEVKVWIFGSRARGDFKEFSDIDLLYELPKDIELPDSFIFKIISEIEDSDLIYKIDLVNIADLAESYKSSVLKDRIAL